MGLVDTWLGSNNNTDRDADTYISRVLNSKVAKNLKEFEGPLKEKNILKLRAEAKTTCPTETVPCNVLQASCLFNIKEDPCERKNLANDPAYAGIFQDLKARLATALKRVSPPRNMPRGYILILFLTKKQLF